MGLPILIVAILGHLAVAASASSSSAQSTTRQVNSLLRVTNLPDFVGFSYTRASPGTDARPRFINFVTENLNINANVIPAFSSFEATQPGVYGFSYNFVAAKGSNAVVALRKNSRTVVAGISPGDFQAPVSQTALLELQRGDVVQLEIMEGKIVESGHPDYAYTTFSGWLIQASSGPNSREFRGHHHHGHGHGRGQYGVVDFDDDFDDGSCCCSRVCPVSPEIRPPYPAPPPLAPPPPRQQPGLSSRPSYIITPALTYESYDPAPPALSYLPPPPLPPPTSSPGHHYVPEADVVGSRPGQREDREGGSGGGARDKCCDAILVSSSPLSLEASGTGRGRADRMQFEKFGLYYAEPGGAVNEATVFKHGERDLYLFYQVQPGFRGWLIGPEKLVGRGGILAKSDKKCPDQVGRGKWLFYDRSTFEPDPDLAVVCHTTDDDVDHRRPGTAQQLHSHYHHHQHYYEESSRSKAGKAVKDFGPAYRIDANKDFVEATFLFPNSRAGARQGSGGDGEGYDGFPEGHHGSSSLDPGYAAPPSRPAYSSLVKVERSLTAPELKNATDAHSD